MKTFAQRVRGARMCCGWTQRELATASGLTQSTIGNYESGQRTEPTGAALIKLANALKVDAEWLREGAATMAAQKQKATQAKAATPNLTWPFHGASLEDYLALSLAEKRILDSMVETFIRSRQAQR
ncbi:helix-turn-helix domain-containing protein [Bordetella sp. BOR01]|uniref:helix-turn-helix domain-containing protein n=1 Tax=Bordetella sp. BOR01 TaxID=2854779 RepID=UPI001C46F898|nr:helix-turn-helix transcriptional regulator [Bordetella sp. BOR01]MBV7482932.1 helix-turn-helix domain-containing protein [Bordetella sp. BOR01]